MEPVESLSPSMLTAVITPDSKSRAVRAQYNAMASASSATQPSPS